MHLKLRTRFEIGDPASFYPLEQYKSPSRFSRA